MLSGGARRADQFGDQQHGEARNDHQSLSQSYSSQVAPPMPADYYSLDWYEPSLEDGGGFTAPFCPLISQACKGSMCALAVRTEKSYFCGLLPQDDRKYTARRVATRDDSDNLYG